MTAITQEALAAREIRVRQLVFEEGPVFGTWIADGYRIEQLGYSFRLYVDGSAFGLRSCKSRQKAIAFANEHNEARILAALEVTHD